MTTSPHRIAFVITELEVGGAERCLTNLALRIDKTRFQPTVFSLAPPPRRTELVHQLASAGIELRFLHATSVTQAWSATRRLRNQLRELAPDLVQTFLYHANVLGSRAARQAGVAHIVHGVRVADPSRLRQRIEKWSARHVDRVVCVSEAVANFLRQQVGYRAEQLIVIPNGIELSRYVARDTSGSDSRSAGRRHIAVVARLHEQKGLDWFLRAMPRVFEQCADVDVRLIGTGPDETKLKLLCRQLGIEQRVQFLGWRDDVPQLLHDSDLFILPSRWEGMSNALLEAMASGLPVLSTRSEGSTELLTSGDKEQLLDYGDTQTLVARALAILRSPQLAKELGEGNRRRASALSLESMVLRYESLYSEMLAGR